MAPFFLLVTTSLVVTSKKKGAIWYNMVMDFEGQRSGEQVLCVFRRHILTSFKGVLFFLFMSAFGVLPMLIWKDDSHMFIVWIAFIVAGLLGMLYSYMLWYFSFYLLTTERLRQVRQKGLFNRSVVDLDLENIDSVSFGVAGLFGTIFNYGTILVQTEAGDLTLSSINKPEAVYNELENAAHAAGRDIYED